VRRKLLEFYKRLIIKILEKSSVGSDNKLLEKLKSGYDLTQKEMSELEELLENIL
jgi:trp operon repressor